jgi:hypothetical protein
MLAKGRGFHFVVAKKIKEIILHRLQQMVEKERDLTSTSCVARL